MLLQLCVNTDTIEVENLCDKPLTFTAECTYSELPV